MNGFVLHEDSHRVVIATGFESPSENRKTGDMIQVWILVKSCDPVEAIKQGLDRLIFARNCEPHNVGRVLLWCISASNPITPSIRKSLTKLIRPGLKPERMQGRFRCTLSIKGFQSIVSMTGPADSHGLHFLVIRHSGNGLKSKALHVRTILVGFAYGLANSAKV